MSPFILFAVFRISIHASEPHTVRRDIGFIQSEHFVFSCVSSIYGAFFVFVFPPISCPNAVFLSFANEGSSHILRPAQLSVFLPGFLDEKSDYGGHVNDGEALMTLVGILFRGVSVQSRSLVPASAARLPGHPIHDDKRQAHGHEDESQGGEAGGLNLGSGL